MTMLGKAALAMWWDISDDVRTEWEDWHAHEHFPERLSIEGFLRASRWTDISGGDAFFVIYELKDHTVLSSAPYVARLNAPTTWSTKMMPLHRNMVRTQCQIIHSRGGVTARHALTIRCSPIQGQVEKIQTYLGDLAESISQRPGIVGLHVLCHEAPNLAPTTEQRIRGNSDQVANWIIVLSGYDLEVIKKIADEELSVVRLHDSGAITDKPCQVFSLAYTAMPKDVR